MNSIKKYVVSSTLTDPTWNNTTVINGDVAAQVRELKEQDGANILQYGYHRDDVDLRLRRTEQDRAEHHASSRRSRGGPRIGERP